MAVKEFDLLGGDSTTVREIDIGIPRDMDDLRSGIAAEYKIVSPSSVGFQDKDGCLLETIEAVLDSELSIKITIDGRSVRDPLGPPSLPFVGNYYEIYPDHLGNHQRLFAKYGSVIKTNSMGRINYLTNDPEIAGHAYRDNEYFTKKTTDPSHPLFGIRDNSALFTCDTDSPAFKIAHKFIPPSMSPKAVRHYTPLIQKSVEDSFKVFDQLDQAGMPFNVYQYMVKLSSQTLGKFILDLDFHHFDSIASKPHEIIVLLTQVLELNKAVQTRGDWYSYLPFGPPKRLQQVRTRIAEVVEDAIRNCRRGGTEDLPIQDAALNATCLVDFLTRATDEKGNKLPSDIVLTNTLSILGAGFTTISALMSWLIYCLITYPGNQDALLQELIDFGVHADTEYTYDLVHSMPVLDNFLKETMRLHSPAFQPARNTRQDLILPGGYRLPANAILIPTLPAIHKNPAYWSNAQRFEPERWTTPEVRDRHKSSYLPFATGARGCIGYNFALQQIKVLLPSLVYRYHWENVGEDPVEYDPEFQVIRPLNIYARAVKRTEWPSKSQSTASAA